MYTLTAADFADTGQWRLLLNIGSTGLEAFLENTLHTELPPQPLCKAQWELNRDKIRENLEEAVYSNPRLLDDFATKIIIYDPRTLFIPTEIAEENADSEVENYNKVYKAESSDVMSDYDRDITATWQFAPGVKSFLMRTFPGARITCNLLEKVRSLRKNNGGLTLHVFVRPEETDIILLEDSNLVSASTHEWRFADDIAFLALNVLDVYGLKLKDTFLALHGLSPETEAWEYIEGKARGFEIKESEK